MKRIVTVDDATGNVIGQWMGGDEQDLEPVTGHTHITLAAGDTADYSRKRWNGTAFEDLPRPTLAVSAYAFMDLFTAAERKAIRQKARGDATASPVVPPDDDIADYVHRLDLKASVGESIELRSPKVGAGLDLLIAKGVLASTRKAQIIAGTPPA